MIAKFVIFALIIAIIYFVFFKKPNKIKSAQDFVECQKCKSFVSIDEMVLSNGEYYCKECLK
nr:hypothetical protein [Campylobacter sp.]